MDELRTMTVECHQWVNNRKDFKPNSLYDRFHFYVLKKTEMAWDQTRKIFPWTTYPSIIVATSAGDKVGICASVTRPARAGLRVTESSSLPQKNSLSTLARRLLGYCQSESWSIIERHVPDWRFNFSWGTRATIKDNNSTPGKIWDRSGFMRL